MIGQPLAPVRERNAGETAGVKGARLAGRSGCRPAMSPEAFAPRAFRKCFHAPLRLLSEVLFAPRIAPTGRNIHMIARAPAPRSWAARPAAPIRAMPTNKMGIDLRMQHFFAGRLVAEFGTIARRIRKVRTARATAMPPRIEDAPNRS